MATYWKVPFEWTSGVAPADDPLPPGWSWSAGAAGAPSVELVADVLATSPGPEDRRAVEALGRTEAARRILAPAAGFSYLPERWHVLAVDGRPAGFRRTSGRFRRFPEVRRDRSRADESHGRRRRA